MHSDVRVREIAHPVPDELADIELVVQDARALGLTAVDRVRAPAATAGRAGNALGVELQGNCAGRRAIGVFREEAPDDAGLIFVDLSPTPDRLAFGIEAAHDIIALAESRRDLPASDRPCKPRWVLWARSLRNSVFIVPLRPIWSSVISPSTSVIIRTPAKVRRLWIPPRPPDPG